MASANYCPKCLTTFADDPTACPNLGCASGRPGPGWGTLLGEGDLLDRHYRITKVLAVGGAGITYQAREVDADGAASGPDLAIKVLFPERDSGPFLRRLANEAQILQDLRHPHIVECRGFVQRSGHAPYLVTAFEGGGTLGAHVARVGPLPPPVAAGVLDQVLEALQVAHDKGIVHRDLKPDNVILAERTLARDVPWARVADFGIAKVFDSPGSRLTRLGTFLGTPEYAAPEQFDGLSPTPATDVWAAGGLLFHLVVGKPPVEFSHRADIESDRAELLAQVPPKLPDTVVPAGMRECLQTVIDATMTPNPGDRWTVQQVRARLAEVPPAPRPSKAPAPPMPTSAPTTWVQTTPIGAVDRSKGGSKAGPTAPTAAPKTASRSAGPTITPRVTSPTRSEAPAPPPSTTGVGAGVVGLGALLFVGSALSVVVLAIAAWGFGWFSPPEPIAVGAPVVLDPIVVASTVPRDPVDPTPADRTAIEAALKIGAADLALLCRPHGDVPVRVVVESNGKVRSAAADPRAVARDPDSVGCVEKAIARMTVPRSGSGAVALTVSLTFPP